MEIINVSTYKFFKMYDTRIQRMELYQRLRAVGIRGTVVVSPEGVNICVAGTREQVTELRKILDEQPRFRDLVFKESVSDFVPFRRLAVKWRKQLVPCNDLNVDPRTVNSGRITPEELKQWYDEGRDFVIIDTRNDYEYEMGSFDNAIHFNLDHFREWGDKLKAVRDELAGMPVVTFCTGGIRCEKAAPEAHLAGFKDVYQLEGGILKYFELVGGEHWHGDCFVFDQRVALKPDLSVA